MQVEIKTSHFEGTHTSYDWQPYDVELIRRNARSIVLFSTRLIEGRKPMSRGNYGLLNQLGFLYRVNLTAIKGL
jgi:hypothetical protein